MRDFNHLELMELTREELIERAKGYKLTSDFYREVCSRNEIIRRHKRYFFDKITKHMVKDVNKEPKWTKPILIKEAKKYKTRTEFKKGNAGAYSACIAFGPIFREKCFKHLPTRIESLTKWSKELLKKEALKYPSRTVFKKGNSGAYSAAVAFGKVFLDSCCRHMLTKQQVMTKWTKNKVKEEALKYQNKRQFKLTSPEAYTKSLKFGIKFHEKNCAHMAPKYITWTNAKIKKELLKYKSFSEVRIKNCKLIIAAANRSREFYKKVTSHLIKEVIPQERNYTEEIFIPRLESELIKFNISFNITPEFYFHHGSKNYFIDILLVIPSLEITIPIEVKHDNCYWKWGSIKNQVSIYNDYFNNKSNSKVFLVSPKGKYGISEDKFISALIDAIETGKIEAPKYNFPQKK